MNLFRGEGTSEATVDFARWLDRGIVLAVLLSCAVSLSFNMADPDLWGHVQYGRDALRHGIPRVTTYSYVARDYPWINHEIFTEYALAIGADWFGAPGLLFGKCLLGVALIAAIMWWAHQQGTAFLPNCGLALFVALTLCNHWSLRPQIASYVCFALLLGLLAYCFQGWEGTWHLPLGWLRRFGQEPPAERPPLQYSSGRMRLLWLAPLLFMVWTNSHGGFLAGLCVYLAYLTLRGIEAFSRNGEASYGLLRRFGLMGAAAVGATFLNPYGPLFHVWLFGDLAVPRPEIVEWRAPALFDAQFLPFWMLAAMSLAAVIGSLKQRDFTQLVILALILWQALTHHRHIAFFAIAAAWWLPAHIDSLMERLGIGRRFRTDEEIKYGWAPPANGSFSAAFSPRIQQAVALVLVLAICLATGRLSYRLQTLRVEKSNYPLAAACFIAERGLTGKMVCTFNWAQYALAAFGAREASDRGIQIQIDGRCRTSYSQEMLDMHFDFLMGDVGPDLRYRSPASGPFDPTRILKVERPDLVLISRREPPSVQVMEGEQERWVLLYQDALAQLWGRRSKYDDPQSAYYLPPAKREVGESEQRGFVYWPALPKYKPTGPAVVSDRDIAADSSPQPPARP